MAYWNSFIPLTKLPELSIELVQDPETRHWSAYRNDKRIGGPFAQMPRFRWERGELHMILDAYQDHPTHYVGNKSHTVKQGDQDG